MSAIRYLIVRSMHKDGDVSNGVAPTTSPLAVPVHFGRSRVATSWTLVPVRGSSVQDLSVDGYTGTVIVQMPRPWVAASTVPSGATDRSFTEALGRPDPSRDHRVAVPPPAAATNTPMSVATTSLPPTRTRSSPGA